MTQDWSLQDNQGHVSFNLYKPRVKQFQICFFNKLCNGRLHYVYHNRSSGLISSHCTFFTVLPCQRFCSFVNVYLCVVLLLYFCQKCSFTRNSRKLGHSPLVLYLRSKWRVKALTVVDFVWSAVALHIQTVPPVKAFTYL